MFIMVSLVVQMLILLRTNGELITNVSSTCTDLGVALTISPLVTTSPPRQLQLSWWHASPQPGDYVALLQTDPNQPFRPLATHQVSSESGYWLSSIQAATLSPDTLGYTSHCLGYWVAYVRASHSVLASSCLRSQPTWLQDHRTDIKDMKLKHMFLPGTHDSAAYKRFEEEEGKETMVTKYTITQEDDVLSQLIHGIRYLDLRVGFYVRSSVQWWANHGVKRIHPLRDIFAQVKRFMQNTNEIVILDLQEFNPGFGSGLDVHLKLVEMIVTELGSYMALPSLTWDARLDDIWRSGRRLIVTYDDAKVIASSTLLWPSVEHRWGDVQTVDSLHNYIKNTLKIKKMPGPKPWAAMAELTPTTWSLLTDRFGGLRQMAHGVNRNVTEWFRGRWGAEINVVAVDFFQSTTIVETAIEWNIRRARQITCDWR